MAAVNFIALEAAHKKWSMRSQNNGVQGAALDSKETLKFLKRMNLFVHSVNIS